MSYIDFHTHSLASDGTDRPAEVLRLAAGAGLAAVALTDHDTVAGQAEFLNAQSDHPDCRAVSGVEISCRFASREIHIVGLFIDCDEPGLLDFLFRQRCEREVRNAEILRRLASCGFPLSPDEPEFAAVPDRSNIGRPHFAAALVRRYGFSSNQSVFEKLLGHSRPAYVPRRLCDPGHAIEKIRGAGGVAVWAHPTYRCRNEGAFLRRSAKTLTKLGISAMEGYYSLFGPAETELVTSVAEKFGLELSIGTGAGGLRVPAGLLEKLEKRRP